MIIVKMIVAGDYVTVHMKFTGHFTGSFGPGELTLAIANEEIELLDDEAKGTTATPVRTEARKVRSLAARSL